MKIKSSENIKKIIFRLTWEKQLVVLCKASIEYILSMVIVGLIQNSINILQAHLNIPQGFEIIHNFQNLSLYVIFIIINFLHVQDIYLPQNYTLEMTKRR
jgi:hypothetical protein